MMRSRGKTIYTHRDHFGLIEVIDTPTTRSLYFGSLVEQSRFYFNAPCSLAFEYQQAQYQYILDHSAGIQSVLMLGLGGGTLASQLNLTFPNWQLDIIEIREALPHIAQHYFYLPIRSNINIITADALIKTAELTGQYDLIIIDLYNHETMPSELSEPDFLNHLARLCRPKQPILFNLWKAMPETNLSIIQYWQAAGYQTTRIQSSQNLLLAVK